jgi:hypothetical protein
VKGGKSVEGCCERRVLDDEAEVWIWRFAARLRLHCGTEQAHKDSILALCSRQKPQISNSDKPCLSTVATWQNLPSYEYEQTSFTADPIYVEAGVFTFTCDKCT